jgi:hypothetical protein
MSGLGEYSAAEPTLWAENLGSGSGAIGLIQRLVVKFYTHGSLKFGAVSNMVVGSRHGRETYPDQ